MQHGEPPELCSDEPGLAACYAAAARGVSVSGERAGQAPLRLVVSPAPTGAVAGGDDADPVAEVRGVNLHARQRVDGRDRKQLERLKAWQPDGVLMAAFAGGSGAYGGVDSVRFDVSLIAVASNRRIWRAQVRARKGGVGTLRDDGRDRGERRQEARTGRFDRFPELISCGGVVGFAGYSPPSPWVYRKRCTNPTYAAAGPTRDVGRV